MILILFPLGRPLLLLAIGSAAGLLLGILAGRVLSYIVYQATRVIRWCWQAPSSRCSC
jgi:hypothetical protein